TPDGDIKLDHWRAVLETDSLHNVGPRQCHKLTEDHLNPDTWQKINVALAWQFWSASVAAPMEIYKQQGIHKLSDSSASSKFCKLLNELCDVLDQFLNYFQNLKKWSNVKLQSKLLEAERFTMNFLIRQGKRPRGKAPAFFNQEDFIFLSQLILGFFGLIRQSCGANTHPEPWVFAQLFRLLSIYSLVKPIKGSNMTGGEIIGSLFTLKDLKEATKAERQKALSDELDDIILNGT
ncbi:hypothetical protein KUF71_004554, partial [Frankliniella fusca]